MKRLSILTILLVACFTLVGCNSNATSNIGGHQGNEQHNRTPSEGDNTQTSNTPDPLNKLVTGYYRGTYRIDTDPAGNNKVSYTRQRTVHLILHNGFAYMWTASHSITGSSSYVLVPQVDTPFTNPEALEIKGVMTLFQDVADNGSVHLGTPESELHRGNFEAAIKKNKIDTLKGTFQYHQNDEHYKNALDLAYLQASSTIKDKVFTGPTGTFTSIGTNASAFLVFNQHGFDGKIPVGPNTNCAIKNGAVFPTKDGSALFSVTFVIEKACSLSNQKLDHSFHGVVVFMERGDKTAHLVFAYGNKENTIAVIKLTK